MTPRKTEAPPAAGILRTLSWHTMVLAQRAWTDLKRPALHARIGASVRTLHVPNDGDAGAPVVALVLLRNGIPYLKAFLEHYRRLGLTEFVFLDNGSTDGTVEYLVEDGQVTVLSTDFPFRGNADGMREWLEKTYARGRWVLMLDIDEFFDFPGSDTTSIPGLVADLDQEGFDAMLCHMLDLYPDLLTRGPDDIFSPANHRNFEVASVVDKRYPRNLWCTLPKGLGVKRNGVRARIFGANGILLSKGCLYRPGRARRDHNPHFLRSARYANRTGVLLHYKFLPSFFDRVDEAVRRRNYALDSKEYRLYQTRTASAEAIDMRHATTLRYEGPHQLLAVGFLDDLRPDQGGGTGRA